MQQTIHLPFYVAGYTLSLKPNPSCLLHYVFSLRLVKLSLHFPCLILSSTSSFPPWGVVRVTLRYRQSHPEVSSEPPWGVLRALFGIILCIHSIAFTPVSLQLGFYFSNHSLWHLHHLFSPGLHRNTSVIATIFLPSNVLYGLAYCLLFLQALVPPRLTPSLSLEHHP